MTLPLPEPSIPTRIDNRGRQRVALTMGFAICQGVVLFGCAGRFDLPRGWLYLGLWLVGILTTGALILTRQPGLINQRGRSSSDARAWDRVWIRLCGIAPFAVVAVAGLDRGRFDWSSLGPAWAILGTVFFSAGAALVAASMLSNPFFETMVRIQTERNHRVATNGPYRWIRHPGYAGWILQYAGAPLILGSAWTFVPAVVMILLYLVRLVLEDRMLRLELPGYGAYAETVRFRLIPGVW